MIDLYNKFFQVLRCAINDNLAVPELSVTEWKQIYVIAQKQSLLAVVFRALERATPPSGDDEKDVFGKLVIEWFGQVRAIERINHNVTANVIKLSEKLAQDKFQSCLLKGQGNGLLYPQPNSRTPGDIDILIRPRRYDLGKRKVVDDVRTIIKYVRLQQPDAKAIYHHIEYPRFNGTDVEVHYRPSFMFNFIYNSRLQHYYADIADEQFHNRKDIADGVIAVPTAEFNKVFLLSHIYNHLFHEGIGLRQLLDYYYVLQNDVEFSNDYNVLFSHLGIRHIAGAIMWILTEYFGMKPDKVLVPVDESRGRFVLNEILQGGNFGKYDTRYDFGNDLLGRNLQRLSRDWRLLRYFPSEAISEPIFRIRHFFWRLKHQTTKLKKPQDI
ncbi:nucleotidyltransferase family protein [Segatella paludivivens]|uniref:nucleotidyltransferase family protein n=1 Tax=Segatella paludivivens TaxID=185294 RepID=UPI000362CE6C|nr:nucleotidyltransferase family protein [Segatella paludivivens]